MTFADAAGGWAVVGIVVCAVLISEGLTYLAVYRKPSYLRLCKSVEELSKKFEKESAKLVPAERRKAHDRNVARLEEEVKEATTRLTAMTFVPSIASGIAFFFLYRVIARRYTGTVVAHLPFFPFALLQRFVQRDLVTDDARACGFGVIYTLATMSFKTNIPKLLGFVTPRSAADAQKIANRRWMKEPTARD